MTGAWNDPAVRAAVQATIREQLCPDCGHVHAGVELGHICIGCPCLAGQRHPARVQANADDYQDAAERYRRARNLR